MTYTLSGKRIVEEASVKSVSSGVATIKTPYELDDERSIKFLTMVYTEAGWRINDPTF